MKKNVSDINQILVSDPLIINNLPPTMRIQVDNCTKKNNIKFVCMSNIPLLMKLYMNLCSRYPTYD